MVLRVNELPGTELLYFVEDPVEPFDGVLNFIPSFVEFFAVRGRDEKPLAGKLSVYLSEGFMHCVQFFMGLL